MATKTKNKITDEPQELQDNLGVSDEISEKPSKKNKKEKKIKEKKEKKQKKKGSFIVPLVIFLVIVGAIGSAIYFDLLGARTKYVMPLLEKVPIVNNLVKQYEEKQKDPLAKIDKKDLAKENEQLKKTITENEDKMNLYADEIKKLEGENARLKEVEKNQEAVTAQKQEFDKMIAENDPTAYSRFYESIDPETAKQIYQDTITKQADSKEFKKYIGTFATVDEAKAAETLTQLSKTDMDLVVLILSNLDNEKAGAIISSMDAKVAARITKRMSPPNA